MLNKIKPFLITAVVSLVSLYLFRKFVGPKIGISL